MTYSRDQYRNLTGSITDAFFAINRDLKFTYWNKGSEKLTGISEQNAIGRSLYEIFPLISGTPVEEAYLRVLKSKSSENITEKIILNNKTYYLELNIYPSDDGIVILARDISSNKDISEKLIINEERYKNILDNMLEGCAIVDFNWNYLYANKVHCRHAQLLDVDIEGKPLLELVPGFEKSKLFKAYVVTMEKRIPQQIEECFQFSNGESHWFEARSIPVPEGIFILSIETTERKKNEAELKRYQSILTQTEKMAHLGSWWIELTEDDINKNKLSWSEEVYRIFGYEPFSVEVTNDLFFSHVHPDDREKIKFNIGKAVEEKQTYDIEHRVITKDGKEKIVHEYASVLYDEEDKPVRIIGAINDITKLRTAIKERDAFLLQREHERDRLRTIIDSVPDEIWVFDNSGNLQFVNPAVQAGIGLDKINDLNLDYVFSSIMFRNIDGSIRKTEDAPLYKSLKGETLTGEELVKHKKTGEMHYRKYSSAPIKDNSGNIFGVVIVVTDLTEHKKTEAKILELLRISELRTAELNAIIESMPDAVYIGSREGMSLCNTNALKMLGADSLKDLQERIGELAGKFNVRWPETGIPLREDELQFSRALNGEIIAEEVLATNAQTGEDIYIRSACAPVIQNGEIIGAVAVNTDITKNKEAVEIIKNSLKEKEVLLRELYHRTKNNMQVISSILGLKAAAVKDEDTANILEEMKNRILSIALVHQKLYQSSNLSRVDLKEYIIDLIKLLKSSYLIHENKIHFHCELDNINVLIDTAIPCGLILNELISNSLKYAFSEIEQGRISITLKRLNGDIIELIIADNGKGMAEGEMNKSQKLGLQLVKLIAEDQLQAETEVHYENGVKWIIRFKDSLYEERI